jgi:hypothetical protein
MNNTPTNTAPIRSLFDLLNDIQTQITDDNISFKELLSLFHERGFGFFLFLFALPAALPLPGLGINTIIALPLLLLTAQQALGRHTIWLPQKMAVKTISKAKIDGFTEKAAPWIKRLEFFIRPRLGFITHGVFSHLIGVMGFIMAIAVSIPLPLTNTVPAFGIALMAIGVLMRDGLAVIGGAIIGLLWVLMLVFVTVYFGLEGIDIAKDFIKSFL